MKKNTSSDELEKTRAIIYHMLTTHKTYSPDDYPTDNHFYAAWIANHIHNNFILKADVVEAIEDTTAMRDDDGIMWIDYEDCKARVESLNLDGKTNETF